MKVGFDARMISHPGIGRYIRNIVTAMQAADGALEFTLYGDPAKLIDFKDCRIKEYKTPVYSLSEIFSNPFKDGGFDLVHIPHFNLPFANIKNLIITVHDLIYLKFPESAPNYIKARAAGYAIKRAVGKAAKIIAVSENTKKDIIERWPDAEKKVKVIYEAADPAFKIIEDEDRKEKIRKRYNLPRDIILFVSSLKRHKNIERLIDAYNLLRPKGIGHRLVIIGRYRPREAEILGKIKSSDALYLGEIPTEDLVVIYNLAALLAVPSLYEGFGLPVLEAMSCGVPVAASSASSLPEVVGDAGVLFDPYDTKDIADSIYNLIRDEALRKKLIEKGLKRAGSFSWDKAAKETMKAYKDVL